MAEVLTDFARTECLTCKSKGDNGTLFLQIALRTFTGAYVYECDFAEHFFDAETLVMLHEEG